jgi:hypothetical protein
VYCSERPSQGIESTAVGLHFDRLDQYADEQETGLLLQNLSTLSTSAPARSVRVDRKVSRRSTCDRVIWTKSLAFAADAEELIFLYGFSMAVSPFDRLERSRSRIVAGGVLARRSLLSLKPGISQLRKKPTSSTR